ncbi:discoidin domain-containing protein [Spirochaeta cellobiosiphila]|uniref:discoidin domain-containing protein n=1 Tax=Spirochaeta cellobiosiphila TaxID=504483 RepID=UPI000408DD72|nr:discoidin domain-containing protein [Spirochaeta cellobiosiphila]
MLKRLLYGFISISILSLFFGCDNTNLVGAELSEMDSSRARGATIYEHTINGYTEEGKAIYIPHDAPIMQKARSSDNNHYFVSVIKSDKNWKSYGKEISEWLGSSDITRLKAGKYSVRTFCAKHNFTLAANTYYRVKFATSTNEDGTWKENTRLIYLSKSLLPAATSNTSKGMTITASSTFDSSTYSAWKAFDGNGGNGWSRWISGYNQYLLDWDWSHPLEYEWINIKLNNPVEAKYIYILPEFSENIQDRMPKLSEIEVKLNGEYIASSDIGTDKKFWEQHRYGAYFPLLFGDTHIFDEVRYKIRSSNGSNVVSIRSIKFMK